MLLVVDCGSSSALGVEVPPIGVRGSGVTCGNMLGGGESALTVGVGSSSSVSPCGIAPGSRIGDGCLNLFLLRRISWAGVGVVSLCAVGAARVSLAFSSLSACAASRRWASSISIASLWASSWTGGVAGQMCDDIAAIWSLSR